VQGRGPRVGPGKGGAKGGAKEGGGAPSASARLRELLAAGDKEEEAALERSRSVPTPIVRNDVQCF